MSATKEVLIVEDDILARQQIAEILSYEGFAVRQADNGLQGLQALRDGIPDLLISDLVMPIMNGMELVEEIVQQYPMLPIIVLCDGLAMFEVAKMLRLGVKDFLFKPIRNPIRNLIRNNSAFIRSVKSVLKDNLHAINHENDFCQQWFNVSAFSDDPISKELSWHFDELLKYPVNARELLLGLMPEPDSRQGNWKLNYHVLQSTDVNPIVLDYAWMQEGKLAFYLVDSASAGDNAVATTLMIRAFFNAFLRAPSDSEKNLIHLAHKIEYAIKNAYYASPIKVIFGLLNVINHQLELISAGLNVIVHADTSVVLATNEPSLGNKNCLYKSESIFLHQGKVKISLGGAALASFLLTIVRLNDECINL